MAEQRGSSNSPNRLTWCFPDGLLGNQYTLKKERVKLITFANCMLSTINTPKIWMIGRTSEVIDHFPEHIFYTQHFFLERGFQRWI